MGSGGLVVKAYMARDALPVEGALVRVVGIDEGASGQYHSRFTNGDGITDIITLPAPPAEYSRSPGAPEQPYSLFKVTVMREGYYPKEVMGVAIFDRITTFLPVNMILSEPGVPAPVETLESESYENQSLE